MTGFCWNDRIPAGIRGALIRPLSIEKNAKKQFTSYLHNGNTLEHNSN